MKKNNFSLDFSLENRIYHNISKKLFFIVIENIKDEYFELGMIAGKVMQDE